MTSEPVVVLCTHPELEGARALARVLVERRVAACVNLIPVIHSIYRWEGAVEEGTEVQLVIKTERACWPELERAIRARHPYRTPELLLLPILAGGADYLDWLAASVAPDGD